LDSCATGVSIFIPVNKELKYDNIILHFDKILLMKIRIKGNSIRYRLTKTEIANFGEQGCLEERTSFINGAFFSYTLQRKPGIENLEAALGENRITLFVPETMAHEWTTTEVIGFDHKMEIGNGVHLFLLIEKDFVCLDNTFEDQSDNFPNPNAVC
jgi:hypothetical protein